MKPSEQIRFFEIIDYITKIELKVTGDAFIKKMMECMAKKLDIHFVVLAIPIEGSDQMMQTHSALFGDKFVENYQYGLKDSPCENVLSGNRVCIFPSEVFADFPNDLALGKMGIKSYAGAPVIASDGTLIGLFQLLDKNNFEHIDLIRSVTEYGANRIAVELSRTQVDLRLKQLEQEVQEKTKAISDTNIFMMKQEKHAAIGRVVAGIAHEIRNPLNLIINGETVASDCVDDVKNFINQEKFQLTPEVYSSIEYLEESLNIVKDNGNRLHNIITNMLSVEKGTEKKLFNLKELLKESIDYVYHAFQAKDPDVKVVLDIDFPINDIQVELTSDIQSLFLNLFENALNVLELKFKGRNAKGSLRVSLKEEEKYFSVKVYDNGVGIPQNIREAIFEPFFTTQTNRGGIGLGLALVDSLAIKNDTEILINSEEGKYTEFEVKIKKLKMDK